MDTLKWGTGGSIKILLLKGAGMSAMGGTHRHFNTTRLRGIEKYISVILKGSNTS